MEVAVDHLDKRVERLEEKHAFAERTAEELSTELVRAYEKIERLTARLGALEKRLGAIESAEEVEEE